MGLWLKSTVQSTAGPRHGAMPVCQRSWQPKYPQGGRDDVSWQELVAMLPGVDEDALLSQVRWFQEGLEDEAHEFEEETWPSLASIQEFVMSDLRDRQEAMAR